MIETFLLFTLSLPQRACSSLALPPADQAAVVVLSRRRHCSVEHGHTERRGLHHYYNCHTIEGCNHTVSSDKTWGLLVDTLLYTFIFKCHYYSFCSFSFSHRCKMKIIKCLRLHLNVLVLQADSLYSSDDVTFVTCDFFIGN